jgi:membrane-associated phospholipid phosphatase
MHLKHNLRFFAVEKITVIYILITALIIILLPNVTNINQLILNRLMIVAIIFILAYLNSKLNWWIISLIRYAFLGGLLAYWYPETFDINRMMFNRDYILADLEQSILGMQPAFLFHQNYSQQWVSELLYMGYLAYYPLIIGTSLYFFFKDRRYFEYFFFTVLVSFFAYYLIFILFPTAGPQFYFQAIGGENVQAGIFPQIGNYFNLHPMLSSPNDCSGLFCEMVKGTQQVGERPTAAFPSSHVGISSLIMILIFKNQRYIYFALLLPIYIALVLATVYIQAHYVIDVLIGFVTSVLFYFLGSYVYSHFTRRYYGVLELTAKFHIQPTIIKTSNRY